MELLLDPRTINSRKVLAGCKLIGAEYTVNRLDYFQAEQTSPAYVAINPMASDASTQRRQILHFGNPMPFFSTRQKKSVTPALIQQICKPVPT